MLISQSASTMASPMSETTTIAWKTLVSTPLSMPFLTSAGSASPATASRPSRTSPMTSAAASGRSSLRRVKCRSPARAWARSTSGLSLAAGSASTWASSSGEGGRLSNIPVMFAPPRLRPMDPAAPRPEAPADLRPPAPAALALASARPSSTSSTVWTGSARTMCAPASSSSGPVMSCRYSAQRSFSSSWVPLSATRPWSRTTIRSARFSVDRRCAMISVVRPRIISRSAAWISASRRGSMAEVASSSSSSRGSVTSARASATRCRCPPDRVRPCSPTTVS